jgi:hypothetical protein
VFVVEPGTSSKMDAIREWYSRKYMSLQLNNYRL